MKNVLQIKKNPTTSTNNDKVTIVLSAAKTTSRHVTETRSAIGKHWIIIILARVIK